MEVRSAALPSSVSTPAATDRARGRLAAKLDAASSASGAITPRPVAT